MADTRTPTAISRTDAIRAARVLLDLELQAGDMKSDALVRMVSEATFLPAWGEYSVLRAKRIPLQGLTYLVGCNELMKLRAKRPKTESLYDFHARILRAGPVPLSLL